MADIGTAYIRIAPNMTGIQSKIAGGLRGSGTQFAKQFGGEISARSAAIAGAIAGVASAAVNKAMSLVGNSVGDAISRVDTLARFPTVMKNLGYNAKDASKEVGRIAENLIGLPTSLDQLTTFVQRIAPVSGGLKQATDVALAFNNAVLAGGGPVYRQADAIEQFSQMLSKGVPDMMAWRTLQEAMPATLSQIAKQLGITSGNTQELYDKLQDGTISFDDFTGAVVDLNKKGLPGFKNFEQQAKDATGGIATGMANAQTAITRGVAKIITAVGQKNISTAIGNIGKAFESVLGAIAVAVPPVLNVLSSVFGFIAANKDIFAPLAVGILTLVAAIKVWQTTTALITAVQAAFNVVLAANPIGVVIVAVVALVAALTYFFTKTETGKKIMQGFGQFVAGVWNGIKAGLAAVGNFFSKIWAGIKSVISGVINWVKSNWPLLLAIITGPIGLAVAFVIKHWDKIKNGAANMIRGLIGFFKSLPGKIVSAIGNMGRLLYDSGKNLVQGLLNGAGSLLSRIGQFFLDKLPGFIKGPFKKALGIASPSKVFAQYGKYIGQGTVVGIEKMGRSVKGAVGSMANDAIAGMSSINGALAGGFNSTVTTSQNVQGGQYETAPKVVQNIQATIHDQMDLNKVSSDLGYAVAMA